VVLVVLLTAGQPVSPFYVLSFVFCKVCGCSKHMTQKIEGLLINPTETQLRTGDKANMTKN